MALAVTDGRQSPSGDHSGLARTAGIGQAKENLAQAFHLRVAQGDGLHRRLSPFGLRLRLGQTYTRLGFKGIKQKAFGPTVVDVAATRTAGEALGPSHSIQLAAR